MHTRLSLVPGRSSWLSFGFAAAALAAGSIAYAEDKPAAAPPAPTAHATMKDQAGATVGEATITQTPHGLLVSLNVTKLPPGVHAFHIHETGKCEAPFKTAGGHFNPTKKKHGVLVAAGKHGGDLPNIEIATDGTAQAQFFVPDLTLKAGDKSSVFDADGSALVIHAKNDDYMTDPTGNAGDRIACGVIEKSAP